jgi:hypothetical protein
MPLTQECRLLPILLWINWERKKSENNFLARAHAEHRLKQQAAAAEKDWNFKSTRGINAPSFG